MLIPHSKQEEIIRNEARFKVIRAGRRSGKTLCEIEMMLYKAVMNKNRNVFFISPTQKQARSIVWEELKARLGKVGEANESRLEMKLPTKDGGHSTIFVGGWENRENFRGLRADHITFDEVDTCKDFFIGWQEIFRPALLDGSGTADFIGTPKKENPNLRRLEKEVDDEWACFHFKTEDNPHIPLKDILKARKELDKDTFQQEMLAEYVEDSGALFKYTALVDMFSNTVEKSNSKYLTVDIAEDGSDKTIFTFWNGLEVYKLDIYSQIQTDGIIKQIREDAAKEQIPYSQIAVDAIGVGIGVASSPLLQGIIAYKSSYSSIRTETSIVHLPYKHFTKEAPLVSEYRNLRSQCIFELSRLVNEHEIAIRSDDARIKANIIEELAHYQDASVGDGKRMATKKEDIKEMIGRSPDLSDTLFMRMYWVLIGELSPQQGEVETKFINQIKQRFEKNKEMQVYNSAK
tara:strand:+ start:1744 stop:3126 length:1383 start_codon:yes stop_codon:yes gene_type:complete